jgi:hypothetical protein
LEIRITRGIDPLHGRMIVLVGETTVSVFVKTVYVLCSFSAACHLQVNTSVFLQLQF